MTFTIEASPNPALWPIGRTLTLEDAAELLRMTPPDLTLLSAHACRVREEGFCLEVKREAPAASAQAAQG
jgi:hypothetical protein